MCESTHQDWDMSVLNAPTSILESKTVHEQRFAAIKLLVHQRFYPLSSRLRAYWNGRKSIWSCRYY